MRAKAGICIIGTELVRGIIQDTHVKTISSDLTRLGYEVSRVVMIPDDSSILGELRALRESCDLVITTGGLGPTSDDITREAIAEAYGAPLSMNEEAREVLSQRVGDLLNEANLRQVLIPAGFTILPNPNGTAPGFSLPGVVYTLPGPPRELLPMWTDQVLPSLRAGEQEEGRLECSVFLTPESYLEQACTQALEAIRSQFCDQELPSWGTRVQQLRISLYLNGGSADSREALYRGIEGVLTAVRVRRHDVQAADLLLDELDRHSLRISGAESCTGGLVSKLLTDVSGASAYFWGTAVVYSNDAKVQMLGVREETLEEYGAVSGPCVIEMAEGMMRRSGSDASFSISGIAGPKGGSEEKPVGTVYLGFASGKYAPVAVRLQFRPFSRDSIRRRAAIASILLLEQYLKGVNLLDIVSGWQYS